MATWFTSDTHLGHANIIKHCARPFHDADEMDRALIENWNARVAPGDDVWHLGDFAFRNGKAASSYLVQLNGRKHLVWGNHDSNQIRTLPQWTSSQPYAEITVEDQRLVLFHYAMRVWNKLHYGALHLYGHSHGTLSGTSRSCDVGTDCWQYAPVSLAEIKERLAILPEAHEITVTGEACRRLARNGTRRDDPFRD